MLLCSTFAKLKRRNNTRFLGSLPTVLDGLPTASFASFFGRGHAVIREEASSEARLAATVKFSYPLEFCDAKYCERSPHFINPPNVSFCWTTLRDTTTTTTTTTTMVQQSGDSLHSGSSERGKIDAFQSIALQRIQQDLSTEQTL